MAKPLPDPELYPKRHRWGKVLLVSCAALLVLLLSATFVLRRTYLSNLSPLSSDQSIKHITIASGSSTSEIADLLKENGIIKSAWAFEWYVRSKELRGSLQAGTYALSPSQTIPEIVDILKEGRIATNLVTILPGKRLEEIKQGLIKDGFKEQDVLRALDPSIYADHPALADKPPTASLEGYLYPESFQRTAETTPEFVIRQSLDQMYVRLTPSLRSALAARGLSLHQGIVLASMVGQEVSKPEDRVQVAQVFYSRLREGMKLESDPTVKYGDPAYNTYEHEGLPPGPISNVNEGALFAVANPAPTDWLYFVSGDDGNTYFSRTLQEHEALTAKYCKILCQ